MQEGAFKEFLDWGKSNGVLIDETLEIPHFFPEEGIQGVKATAAIPPNKV
jgi:hypothetical protein